MSQQLLGDEPGQLLLLDDVTEVQLYFFRGNGWSNAQSSGDLTPAAPGTDTPQREALPSGARLQLAIGEQQLVRDLVLPPQSP